MSQKKEQNDKKGEKAKKKVALLPVGSYYVNRDAYLPKEARLENMFK